jgi:hypothetical protein
METKPKTPLIRQSVQYFTIKTATQKPIHEWISLLLLSNYVASSDSQVVSFIDFQKWLSEERKKSTIDSTSLWSLTCTTKENEHQVQFKRQNYNLYCEEIGGNHSYRFQIKGVSYGWSLKDFHRLIEELKGDHVQFYHSSSQIGIQWPATTESKTFVSSWFKKLNKPAFIANKTDHLCPQLRFDDVTVPFQFDYSSDWTSQPNFTTNLLSANAKQINGFLLYGVSSAQLHRFKQAMEKMGCLLVQTS